MVMKVVLRVMLWKFISHGSCDCFTFLSGNPSTALLVALEIPLKLTGKSNVYVNHGNDET